MGKRAKHYARQDFRNRKRIAKAGPSKGWTREEVRPWFHGMRNAVAAYHAGAPWMHPGQSAMVRMAENNARLRAEVKRLRSAASEAVELLNECRMATGEPTSSPGGSASRAKSNA